MSLIKTRNRPFETNILPDFPARKSQHDFLIRPLRRAVRKFTSLQKLNRLILKVVGGFEEGQILFYSFHNAVL
ncbi:hypothetical protein CEXT_583101 [Caerostris extrusa]|uniref:Uncharacterized protein n=1 Tax=Caerostris extrusa TaxID=172846 RepID=A0AAV4RTL5_CAEEX|nr:hypothetical protein CEXT_583101 [Caerostris extrusa]